LKSNNTTIFESRSLVVRRYTLSNPNVTLFELEPKSEYKATILIVPHPLIGCKPYILFTVLLVKRGFRVYLPCAEFSCIKTRFNREITQILDKVEYDIVITHNFSLSASENKLQITLITPDIDLIKICEDNISVNCVNPAQCIKVFNDEKILNTSYEVNINLLDLDSILAACNRICDIARQYLYTREVDQHRESSTFRRG